VKQYGLIGYPLSHSFSENYFQKKFDKEGIVDCSYHAFPLRHIEDLSGLIEKTPGLKGLNVTIPYKEKVIPFLDKVDPAAAEIGAVNTIRFKDGSMIGFNTDHVGFKESLKPLLQKHRKKALILGTGGSSKAVAFSIKQLGISFTHVSRKNSNPNYLTYDQLSKENMGDHTLIINTSPLGMYPNIEESPQIPYHFLGAGHLLFDLVYNPQMTLFLKKGKAQDAQIKNGLEMLKIQAEESWKIWNSND
jgi:shikimate dehydrogenase